MSTLVDDYEDLDRHERLRTQSIYWSNQSSDLRSAAHAVWQSEKASGVYLRLCGMSLELMYKAIAVAMNRTPKEVHSLLQLAEAIDLVVEQPDRGLLEILTHAIEWYGRYPVPKAKRRDSFERVAELVDAHLFDRKPMGRFSVSEPNDRLDWDGFDRLWSTANARHWEHYQLAERQRAMRSRPQR